MPPITALAPFSATALRSSARTASASSPSGERNLPLTISLARMASMMASYSGPSGRLSGTIGGDTPMASGLPRADSMETRPSTPSASCRSIMARRKASSCGFFRRSLPSTTTRTSYSLEGKRRSISS